MQAMLGFGNQITSASSLRGHATGTIIVFVENGEPKHSCIALSGQRIGGCNQTRWFDTDGARGGYSVHVSADMHWHGGFTTRDMVRGSNDSMRCKLYAIPENTARAALRLAV